MVISLNISAQNSARLLVESIARLFTSLARLSSGSRIRLMSNQLAVNSRIANVAVARERKQYARCNILVLAGTAVLGQANATPQSALRLLE